MKKKWFYDMQSEAQKRLDEMYTSALCNWQVITADRIIESFTAYRANEVNPVLVEVHYIRRGSRPDFFIYELTFKASS